MPQMMPLKWFNLYMSFMMLILITVKMMHFSNYQILKNPPYYKWYKYYKMTKQITQF